MELFLATWFHDIVYQAYPGKDEKASAEAARDMLAPLVKHQILTCTQVDTVATLIESTINHTALATPALSAEVAQAFLDADMAILASSPDRYRRYCTGIRHEYADYSDQDFRHGRAAFLEEALARPHLFGTEKARLLWEEKARSNLMWELQTICDQQSASYK